MIPPNDFLPGQPDYATPHALDPWCLAKVVAQVWTEGDYEDRREIDAMLARMSANPEYEPEHELERKE